MKDAVRIWGRMTLGESVASMDLVKWAEAMLLDGRDSPSLRVLAGLDTISPMDNCEVQNYFSRALAELSIPLPTRDSALRQYADLLIADLDAGTIEYSAAMPDLALCYKESKHKELNRIAWQILSSLIYEYESDDYNRKTPDEIKQLILEEVRLFHEFEKLHLPDHFAKMVFCTKCAYFGLPDRKRIHFEWLPKVLYRAVFNRPPHLATVCPKCHDYRTIPTYWQEGRQQYLKLIENKANNQMQAIAQSGSA